MKRVIAIGIIAVLYLNFLSCGGNDPAPDKSKACEIVAFTAGGKEWSVSGATISASFTKGTELSSLAPTIEVSAGATVTPESGVAQDFSSGKEVVYTVTAEDGVTTKTWTAKATVN